jgi:hypothetical protein
MIESFITVGINFGTIESIDLIENSGIFKMCVKKRSFPCEACLFRDFRALGWCE